MALRYQPNSTTRRSRFETLEPRNLLAAQPVLTEFVASNDSTINDGFGNDSDWIEIYNPGDMPVDLQGYHLTDDSSDSTKWSFSQPTILAPKEYLVVFASSDDTIDPAGYWHTNFNLGAGGEFVGLADPAGVILSDFGLGTGEYPPQVTDISYGLPGPVSQTLLATTDDIDYLVPANGSLGTNWTTIGFDSAANGFVTSGNGIGYEDSGGSGTSYSGSINTALPSGTTTTYVRSEFELVDADEVAELSLALTYDDGFAVYLNGTYLFGENEPATPLAYNSVAVGNRSDSEVLSGPVSFSLNDYLSLLQDGENVLAIHALNNSNSSDMLLTAELSAEIGNLTDGVAGYLIEATPGAANSQTIDLGPVIEDVEFAPSAPGAGENITVTAEISPSEFAVDLATPMFYYRVNFGSEVQVVLADNGLGADDEAGDGTYTAQIPASAFEEGDLVRWYITAADTNGTVSRAPRFVDPNDSAEYFGTVILDSTASDDLPVLYWFVEDEAAAATREGTRASIYYRGEFYDNIKVALHGQSTALPEFIKNSFDFDANKGEKFEIGDSTGKHSDFNLITNYADQSKVRNAVAYAALAETGSATHIAHPVSVHRNGEFYALYDFVEQGDEEYLRRLGLDEDGALYKVNNDLSNNATGAYEEVEKKSRTYEDHSDFQEVIDANDLSGSAARTWYFDNLDIAEIINYAATLNVIQNSDFGHKNNYWYRDSNNTKLWKVLPWDVDLSFGHMWGFGADPPYFNNTLFTNISPTAGYNNIFQNFVNSNLDSRITEMYKRRVRSISDQLLGTQGSPVSESWVYQQFEQWGNLTADEAIQDMNEWGIQANFTHTPAQAVTQIQNSFISAKRTVHNNFAGSQSSVQEISFDTVEFAPSSGNQDEEYFVLTNDNQNFATDISNWSISGAINHTFKPGTVIPAGETLYVLADVQGFQARTSGPRGGQQLFTQGNYQGRLSNAGGELTLANAAGAQIDTVSYVGSINGGDFDADGDFDGKDFLAWQRGFGLASGASPVDGDADEDGRVDSLDLDLWSTNYAGSALNALAAELDHADSSAEAFVSEYATALEITLPLGVMPLESNDTSVAERSESFFSNTAFAAQVDAVALTPSVAGNTRPAGTQSTTVSDRPEADKISVSLADVFDSVFEQEWS